MDLCGFKIVNFVRGSIKEQIVLTMSERTVQRLFSRSFAAKKLLQNQKRNCFTDVSQKSMSGVRLIAEAVADRTDIADISQSDTKLKTIDDLPGPRGYPVVGTAPEYFRKANRGQMHEVQVSEKNLLRILYRLP